MRLIGPATRTAVIPTSSLPERTRGEYVHKVLFLIGFRGTELGQKIVRDTVSHPRLIDENETAHFSSQCKILDAFGTFEIFWSLIVIRSSVFFPFLIVPFFPIVWLFKPCSWLSTYFSFVMRQFNPKERSAEPSVEECWPCEEQAGSPCMLPGKTRE